jgi:hypothetical protein
VPTQLFADDALGEITEMTDFAFVVPDDDQPLYAKLKSDLLQEARESGDQAPDFVFHDDTLEVEIGYGFKEFMDRFPKGAPAVKRALKLDGDTRPYQDIFRDVLATPAAKKAYADRENEVLDKLRQENYRDAAAPPIDQTAAPKDALVGAMATQQGLCLGDDHGDANSKEMLIAGLGDLKSQGVNTLFIEHFWQEHQTMLDAYIEGEDDELPAALAEAVRKLDLPFAETDGRPFERLLAEAKRTGMRIVGLDEFSAKTPQNNDPRNWERRAARFNDSAAETVRREKDKKGGGKFLLMAGKAHNNTHDGGIPGISQLLGVPAVTLGTDGKLKADPEDESKRGMRSEAEQAFVDAFVERFRAQQAGLLAAAPPGGKTEKMQATMRAAAIMKAANDVARGFGAGLDRLAPAKLLEAAQQAADRAIAPIASGSVRITSQADADKLTAAANAQSAEYTEIAGKLKTAAANGAASYADFKRELVLLLNPAQAQNVRDASAHLSPPEKDEIERRLAALTDPRLLMESLDVKVGGQQLKGLSPLHVAALSGDARGLQDYVAAGLRPDAPDADGNTALHDLAFVPTTKTDAGDDPAIARALINAGASLTAKNPKGQTPVHLAAFGGKTECMKEMAKEGSFGAANVADKRGWLPVDMATAAGRNATEDYLFANGHATPSGALTQQEEADLLGDDVGGEDGDAPGKLTTIDILVRASKAEGPVDGNGQPTESPQATEQRVRDLFTKLYAQPEFRSVLDLAAADAMGKRNDTRKALRLYFNFNSDFAGTLTGKGGKGAFDDRSNTLVIGAARNEKELLGTMVHELTHHAADMVFGNKAVPYGDENSETAVAYRGAIAGDYAVASKFLGEPEKSISYTLGGRMMDYRRANLGEKRLPLLQEYLVGIPQVIAEHGIEYAQKLGPNLLAFFNTEFKDACDTKLGEGDDFARVVDNSGLLATLPPVAPVDTTSTTWLGVSKTDTNTPKLGDDKLYMGLMIVSAHRANTGTCPATYPNSTEYQSVQGKPRVFDWSMPNLPTPEDGVIEGKNVVGLLDKRLREIAKDLPPEVKAEFMETLIQQSALQIQGITNDNFEDRIDAIAEQAREAVREAKLAYLARAEQQGKLTPDLVARTAIYEAACQALENDARRDDRVAGAGPDLSDTKIEEMVRNLTDSMTMKQVVDLARNPNKIKLLATSMTGSQTTGKYIKTSVVNGFYTKKVGRSGEKAHVSLNVQQASRKWISTLATM